MCSDAQFVTVYAILHVSLPICLTIIILDVIDHPLFSLQTCVTEFSIHLQVKPTQMNPVERTSLWSSPCVFIYCR
jgi:hypothetical protein